MMKKRIAKWYLIKNRMKSLIVFFQFCNRSYRLLAIGFSLFKMFSTPLERLNNSSQGGVEIYFKLKLADFCLKTSGLLPDKVWQYSVAVFKRNTSTACHCM